ncbi:aminotransferase class IV [Clostridium sp. CM028]|uniref:aminotransferase class IV n=1 Tax=unclassified Clostridium TaxID=2614128 RepID=UPI001C0D108F|nr:MULTISPECIES: aminotransferase class IV [unclassified Clostridium]MBU3091498.1 aminotransferase class IV [Clostridium sp. CF011]MBW9144238.1 aminotransferase class IV [Clostridium sp. CM027]MBW9147452.1 aminotransferase class IV [Clostridium sp. CM028]UVE41125.1 aminotransferase class IV [Clostridium sp. CM027]WAG70120.1 aminotransferase class IV [Clostridium sp. CF011]
MDKCINAYFLFGGEIKKCEEFENYHRSKGKSLYEVIRISDGIPIFLMEHLDRLYDSAKIMKYNLTITRDEIINEILKLIYKNKAQVGNIKLVINYSPSDEKCNNKNDFNEKVLLYFLPHSYPSKEQYVEGVKTITYHGERSNPNAKVINSVFRDKVNEQINSKDVYEAILVDDEGFITEGSKSNIFMVEGSTVVTSKVANVLPGITRQFVIKTCEKLNIVFEEKNIHERDLESLTGLFISGTSPNVLPIKNVDEFSFDSSKNQIINSIMKKFDDELTEDKQKFVKFIHNRTT